ncbi:MAG: GNAT family N-acetyltransferase [Candidatus Phaeomarinobacter sp.]
MTQQIRRAVPGEAGLVHALLRGLAEYEKLLDEFHLTRAQIDEALFADTPHIFCELAYVDGEPAGLALWYRTFPSFSGKYGMWLEDLFVTPEHRGAGLGFALLTHLAGIVERDGMHRMEWNVLPWNDPSIRFYESLGARRNENWLSYALEGDALAKLAARAQQ